MRIKIFKRENSEDIEKEINYFLIERKDMENSHDDDVIKKIVRSEWSQIITVIIAVCGMFFWSVSLTNSSVEAIRQDVKDFHGRLCSLEEKYFQLRENTKG